MSKNYCFRTQVSLILLICFFCIAACLVLKESRSPLYEEFLRSVFTVMSSRDAGSSTDELAPHKSRSLNHRNCVEILTQLLTTKEMTVNYEPRTDDHSLDALQCGLAVDWYEMFEPEVVNVHPLQQRQMLFSAVSGVSDDSSPLATRQSPNLYLLALLTHQTSWSTLQDTLDWLLTQETGKINR